jgi:hypothetical protein
MDFLKYTLLGIKMLFVCLFEKIKPKKPVIVKIWEGTGHEQDFEVSRFSYINTHAKIVDTLELADKNHRVLARARWFTCEYIKNSDGKVFSKDTPCKETWFKEMTESALKTIAKYRDE